MPGLVDKRQVVGAECFNPCVADKRMVEGDGFCKFPEVFIGDAAVVVCQTASSVGKQPEFGGVRFSAFDGYMDMDGFAVFSHPEEQDVLTDDEDFRHYAVSLSSAGASASSKMSGALLRRKPSVRQFRYR